VPGSLEDIRRPFEPGVRTGYRDLTAIRTGTRLSEPTGPLALIVARVEGRWVFEPAGTGVRITWSWDVEPRNRAAHQALPAFARFWRGYARGALEGLEGILLSSQEST
jgi:hypothetical protein